MIYLLKPKPNGQTNYTSGNTHSNSKYRVREKELVQPHSNPMEPAEKNRRKTR